MTRVKTHTLGAYTDCFEIMEKARSAGGLILTFSTSTQATQFRHRCYSARKTLSLKNGGETVFDSMLIIKAPETPTQLTFRFRSAADLPVTITGLDGLSVPEVEDDLARQIADLKKGFINDLEL